LPLLKFQPSYIATEAGTVQSV